MKKITRQRIPTDWFVFLFVLLQVILAIRAPTATHALRMGIEEFLAIAPIYYVFSRYPKTIEDLRSVSAAFVLSGIILSAVAFFEFSMGWHFYNHIADAWQVELTHGYKMRDQLSIPSPGGLW